MKNQKKSKNIQHSHSGQIIASGHNTNDKKFLKGNAGLLHKLQQKIA